MTERDVLPDLAPRVQPLAPDLLGALNTLAGQLQRLDARMTRLTQSDPFFTLPELTKYSSLSRSTLTRSIAEDGLPHYKIRGRVVVRRSEFDRWVSTQCPPKPLTDAGLELLRRRVREVVGR